MGVQTGDMIQRRRFQMKTILLTLGLLCGLSGCSFDALLRNTASLGGDTAGDRGEISVVFINNTPYRAIFTAGTYDNLDQETTPDIVQVNSDSSTLEGNTQLAPGQLSCGRVMSVGGAGLVTRIRENLADNQFDDELLFEDIRFSSAEADEEGADAATEGTAPARVSYIGSDFECGSLLIYRLEFNDVGPSPFTVELTVIPAESNRG